MKARFGKWVKKNSFERLYEKNSISNYKEMLSVLFA